MYEVEMVDEPERVVVGVPHRGTYAAIGAAFERLGRIAAERGLAPEEMLGVYLDDPRSVPEPELRALAALRLGPGAAIPEGLEMLLLPGGRHARLRLHGPYEALPSAYEWLYGTWLPGSGERERGTPGFEVYVNDPSTVPPENLLTDILIPLA